jgi:hypothetical protein
VAKTIVRHTNLYTYAQINYPRNVTWTLGGSADFFENSVDRDQFNPEIRAHLEPYSCYRVARGCIQGFERTLISSQTLEPTQVAGFNQFVDDVEGTESWRYGIAIDQKFSTVVYAGVEASKRRWKYLFHPLALHFRDQPSRLGRKFGP